MELLDIVGLVSSHVGFYRGVPVSLEPLSASSHKPAKVPLISCNFFLPESPISSDLHILCFPCCSSLSAWKPDVPSSVLSVHLVCEKCRLVPFCLVDIPCTFCCTVSYRSEAQVKHYHIKKNGEGKFFLAEKHAFKTIPELIYYHKHNCAGLCFENMLTTCDLH